MREREREMAKWLESERKVGDEAFKMCESICRD
jgi:hypothetical protein